MRRFVAAMFAGALAFGPLATPAAALVPMLVPDVSTSGTATLRPASNGWWNRYSGPQENVPATVRGQAPAPAAPTSVPSDAIAVGATGQQIDKVAAVAFPIGSTAGLVADAAYLRLKEHPSAGAQANADRAVLGACAITSTWRPAKNGNWVDKPGGDCNRPLLGTRAADGSWTFDVTGIAAQWFDGSVPIEGILLFVAGGTVAPSQVPATVRDQAPRSDGFQVSFRDSAPDDISLELTTSAAPAGGSALPSFATVPEPPGEDLAIPEPVFDPGLSTESLATGVTAPAPALPKVELVQPTAAQELIVEPNVLGNLPWATVLLVPLLLAGAIVLMLTLGPGGDPVATIHREGAISRALARHGM